MADLFLNNEQQPPADEPGATIIIGGKVVAELDFDDEPDGEFDWSPESKEIIVKEQLAVALYRNRWNGVVIRQERTAVDDGDHYVCLRDAEAVKALIAALQHQLKVGWP